MVVGTLAALIAFWAGNLFRVSTVPFFLG
jgi:hypothetical protein